MPRTRVSGPSGQATICDRPPALDDDLSLEYAVCSEERKDRGCAVTLRRTSASYLGRGQIRLGYEVGTNGSASRGRRQPRCPVNAASARFLLDASLGVSTDPPAVDVTLSGAVVGGEALLQSGCGADLDPAIGEAVSREVEKLLIAELTSRASTLGPVCPPAGG